MEAQNNNPLYILKQNNRLFLKIIIYISIIGIILSSYLIYLHYKPSVSKFCIIGENFDCDVVNKSTYSELFGIPIALFGGLTYLLFFVVSLLLLRGYDFSKIGRLIDEPITTKTAYSFLLWLAVVAFLFSLYLTYVEAFVLRAYCIFCLISFAFIISILVILLLARLYPIAE